MSMETILSDKTTFIMLSVIKSKAMLYSYGYARGVMMLSSKFWKVLPQLMADN